MGRPTRFRRTRCDGSCERRVVNGLGLSRGISAPTSVDRGIRSLPMTADEVLRRQRRSAWWRMIGAVVVMAAGVVAILGLLGRDERRHEGWIVESAVVGKSVSQDERVVTIRHAEGPPQTVTMSVRRTVREGDVIEVWHAPNDPEAVERTGDSFDPQILFVAWMCGVGSLMVFVTSAFALRRIRALERVHRSPFTPRPAIVQTWEAGIGGNRKAWMAVWFADLVPMDPRMVVANQPAIAVCALLSATSFSQVGVGIRLPVTGVFVARVKTSGGPDMTTLVYGERSELLLAGRQVGGQGLPGRPTDPGSVPLLEVQASRLTSLRGPAAGIITTRQDALLVLAAYLARVVLALLTPLYLWMVFSLRFSSRPSFAIFGVTYALAAIGFGLPALVQRRLRVAATRAPADGPTPPRDHAPDQLRQAAEVVGWSWVPAPHRILTALLAYELIAIVVILLTISR